jgi:hypothetical protein
MPKRLRLIATMLGLVAFALVAAGCHKVNGGGWLTSSTGEGKTTFAFHGKCVEGEDGQFLFYEGQLQWNDHGAGVRFHGDVEVALGVSDGLETCEEAATALADTFNGGDDSQAQLNGTYRPQPRGAPGDFELDVDDNGEPGSNGDTVCIQLFGGLYDGYTNCGTIQGGNVQVK